MLKWPQFRLSSSAVRTDHKRGVRSAVSKVLVSAAASAVLVMVACAGAWSFSGADGAVVSVPLSVLSSDSPTAPPPVAPAGDPSLLPCPTPTPTADVTASPDPTVAPAPKVTPAPKVAPPRVVKNSLTIAALGINASIKGMSTCGGLISNAVYRWPCAGANNLYLLGHAYGVFKPVHDGYHAGRLKPGMIARYTDASGKVHKYTLAWVEDLPIATWGKGATWAATSGSVITLQTCDGPSDGYRIIVRFVPA
jgi:hypothetical protein